MAWHIILRHNIAQRSQLSLLPAVMRVVAEVCCWRCRVSCSKSSARSLRLLPASSPSPLAVAIESNSDSTTRASHKHCTADPTPRTPIHFTPWHSTHHMKHPPSKKMTALVAALASSKSLERYRSLSPWYLLRISEGRMENICDCDSYAAAWAI